MYRRRFIAASTALTTTTVVGCLSSDEDGTNGSESRPMGAEDAVEHYNTALELLERNTAEFDDVRQQVLLGETDVEFRASTITSRTDEARRQLDRAAENDDGSLDNEIETLRHMASYQDTLARFNEEYLKLTRLADTGVDALLAGQHQHAIDTFQTAHHQVETVKSSLTDVEAETDALIAAADSAQVGDEFRDELLRIVDDHAEGREELRWFEQMVSARIDETRGDQAFETGTAAFDDGHYGTARSEYSTAENYFVAAKTQLKNLDIDQTTNYLRSLANDTARLECEYGFWADAADELQQAAQAMENENPGRADKYLESADRHLSNTARC